MYNYLGERIYKTQRCLGAANLVHPEWKALPHPLEAVQRPEVGFNDALGFAGGTGGVEDKKIILGVHLLGRAIGRGFCHQFVIPDIAAGDDVAGFVVAFHNDDF
jgi:hypothetical protein